MKIARIRLVEHHDKVATLFRDPLVRIHRPFMTEVFINDVEYAVDNEDGIELRVDQDDRLATVKIPLRVAEFEVRRIYK